MDYEDLWPLICWLPSFSQITPDHPNWYKLDINSSSSTLVEDFGSPRSASRRSRSSFSAPKCTSCSGASSTDVNSNVHSTASVPFKEPESNSVPYTNSHDIPLMTENPRTLESSSSGNTFYGEHYTSLEQMVCTGTGGSEASPLRPSKSSSRAAHHFYQFLTSNYHSSPDLTDSPSTDEEPTVTALNDPTRRPRHVRFHSHTLVNPQPHPSAASIKRKHPVDQPLLSPSGSTDSLLQDHSDWYNKPVKEDIEANPRCPQQVFEHAGYADILPHVSTQEQLKPAAIPPPERIRDVFPLWRFMAFLGRWIRRVVTWNFEKKEPTKRRKRNPYIPCESDVPLQIWLTLSRYVVQLYP